MDASNKAVFTIKEQINTYRIFKSIDYSDSTQKYDAEIDLLYIQWMYIKRTTNDSIRGFASRVQIDAAQFYGTDYKVNPKALTRRWRKGFGYDFQASNKMFYKTGNIPRRLE